MTRKKEAEEDRMEWLNGGKGKKSSMLYTSHTSGPGDKGLSLSSFLGPPHPPKLSLLTGREGETVQLPDRRRLCQTLHMLSFVSLLSFLPGSSSSGGVRGGNNAAADADY